MKAYIEDERLLLAVSVIVTALSIIVILSSPFVYNLPTVFYTCIALTIVAGLYLSKGISHAEEKKKPKAGRSRRQRK